MGAQMQRRAYSRVCGASTAFRPVAVGVGGAKRGALMSQSAYRRVCGAVTPKGAAQRGCSATGPTPRATGSLSHVRVIRRQDPLLLILFIHPCHPWADSSQYLVTDRAQLRREIIGGNCHRSLL